MVVSDLVHTLIQAAETMMVSAPNDRRGERDSEQRKRI